VARDLVCLSHLRWDFVYQRPNHLMARAARDRRVFFVEEPLREDVDRSSWRHADRGGVRVATPVLPETLDPTCEEQALAELLESLLLENRVDRPIAWFITPMALPWTKRLVDAASAVVYDSMDYLPGFRGAPPRLLELEEELIERADLVFAGGASLHRRMQLRHRASHRFPSSIDVSHFAAARGGLPDPIDQAGIPAPRIGYAGVIDERLDLDLVAAVADARPNLSVVLVGPVVKIDPTDLPARPNVHTLGLKPYAELPAYLAGWDIGWMPFAHNDATRYISPTKTPEYLAAGLPVVSTSIDDVVEPYGRLGLVAIADTVAGTLAAVDAVFAGQRPSHAAVDTFLAAGSWDRTWAAMDTLIDAVVAQHDAQRPVAGGRDASRPRRGSASSDPVAVGALGALAHAPSVQVD
jgi:glycosyltransferase involved in cell wall biosynthesis